MSAPKDNNNTDEAAVDEALRQLLAAAPEFVGIREIRRQPSEYRSSFALEEIAVTFVDGRTTSMIFKDVGWNSLTPAARRAKLKQLYNPLREIEVYRRVLGGRPLGTARCHGAIVDPPRNRYWLFMEKAPGAELYQYGEIEVWGRAARWLAEFHSHPEVAAAAQEPDVLPRLVRYDADFFRSWIGRAVSFATARRGARGAELLPMLAERYDAVVDFLAALPRSFIHGEFYASNVLVDIVGQPPRVCPVDWEMAGIGSAAIDLAALAAGDWERAERQHLLDAYRCGLPAGHPWANDPVELDQVVGVAQLHLAVQWLGWSPDWKPPADHDHDWFEEAIDMAERLGIL